MIGKGTATRRGRAESTVASAATTGGGGVDGPCVLQGKVGLGMGGRNKIGGGLPRTGEQGAGFGLQASPPCFRVTCVQ